MQNTAINAVLITCLSILGMNPSWAAADNATEVAWNPLAPADLSSPRATLATFLDNANLSWEAALAVAERGEELSETQEFTSLRAQRCLDLSKVPVADREDVRRESAIMLLDVFNRIPLPDLASVPDKREAQESELESWEVPGTPIVIAKVMEGARAGQWLFSPYVVNRLPEYYRLTRGLPLNPEAVVDDGYVLYSSFAGSGVIPIHWVVSLPAWAQRIYLGQTVWQWFSGAILLFLVFTIGLRVLRISRSPGEPDRIQPIRFVLAPLLLMILSWGSIYILDVQLNFTGEVLSILRIFLLSVFYLFAAWAVMRAGTLLGLAIKRSARFRDNPSSHGLIDTLAFFASLLVVILVVANGAGTLGVPLAGVLTGLGVGGIAVALAAQSTLENLFGGLTLFIDHPIRVGDYCKFGDTGGTVERIGLRSTRIRTLERTIISVPNAEFSKIQIESIAARDKLLLKNNLYLRMFTSNRQIRQVLDGFSEVLRSADEIDPDSVRVGLVSLGPQALEIEIMAYYNRNEWLEFFRVREAIYLEFMRVVEEAGTSFVPPAQIQYNVELDPLKDPGKEDGH